MFRTPFLLAGILLGLAVWTAGFPEPALAMTPIDGDAGPLAGETATPSFPGDVDGVLQVAASDCSSAARKAASQTGGQVLSVSQRDQGGKTVCVVTVLVPGKDGGRPRKTTVTVKP